MVFRIDLLLVSLGITGSLLAQAAFAESSLSLRIDALAEIPAGESVAASLSTDWEFLRRVTLDFTGDIPPAKTVRAFMADPDPAKRKKLIDQLLGDKRYASHMADQFNIVLMERRGENLHWRRWLEASFAGNKPWDQMVREIVRADQRDETQRGAAYFYSRRLEKYGANAIDYSGLTGDVGRLLLGIDLRCAECHNHRTIDHYKQADFQGLFATFQNLKLHSADPPAVAEGIVEKEIEFASVFNGKKRTTGPRVPGLEEIAVKTFEKDAVYALAPDKKARLPGVPKFSPLARFAEQFPLSPTFDANIANRLWFLMIGKGLVEPLDLHHPDNPPSNPELMKLLSSALKESGYDIKFLLREIALTKVYQRTGILAEGASGSAHLAIERRLSAAQRHRTFLSATGTSLTALGEEQAKEAEKKFLDGFANEPKEPEHEFTASLKGTLMLLNDDEIAGLIAPANENLAAQVVAAEDDAVATEKLFLNIFSRPPTSVEREETIAYLKRDEARRAESISDLIWAMLSSTEFATNH